MKRYFLVVDCPLNRTHYFHLVNTLLDEDELVSWCILDIQWEFNS